MLSHWRPRWGPRRCPVNEKPCNTIGVNQHCKDFFEVSADGTPYVCLSSGDRETCDAMDKASCQVSSLCSWTTPTADAPDAHCAPNAMYSSPCARGERSECHRGARPGLPVLPSPYARCRSDWECGPGGQCGPYGCVARRRAPYGGRCRGDWECGPEGLCGPYGGCVLAPRVAPWPVVGGSGCCFPQRRRGRRFEPSLSPSACLDAPQRAHANQAGSFFVYGSPSGNQIPVLTCEAISEKLRRGDPLTRQEMMTMAGSS